MRFPNSMVVEKVASLSKTIFPIILASLIWYSKSFISMLFLGRLGEAALSGSSLSLCFANITGYSVLKGLAMGMEPLCHQAYGAEKWMIMSRTYRKSLFLLTASALTVSVLWLNMGHFFLWLGHDEKVAAMAQIHLRYSILDLISQAYFHPLKTFLRTQNINRPITIAVTVAMLLHFPINYFLVVYLGLGVRGVALASGWNTLNVNIGLQIYLYMSNTSIRPWHGDTESIFADSWRPLLAMSASSVVSVCLEWWCYEILLLLCTLLGNPQANVAAMGILIQTTSLLYVFPHSFSSALSIMIGHELGSDQPKEAQKTAVLGFTMAAIWGVLAFIFTIAVKNVWGKLFTNEVEILHLVSITLPILGFCELGNCPQTASCGILVGSARPDTGLRVNFISFYLIGLPVAALLAFKLKMGFVGLWFGLGAAQVCCTCIMVCTLVYTDWVHEARRAQQLMQEKEEEEEEEVDAENVLETPPLLS